VDADLHGRLLSAGPGTDVDRDVVEEHGRGHVPMLPEKEGARLDMCLTTHVSYKE